MRWTRVSAARLVAAVGAVLLLLGLTGCTSSHRGRASGAFSWLAPTGPPRGWHVARIVDGATLPVPPGWTPIKTDSGTASAALLGPGGRIEGYLNATPKQGTETLANWSRFRPQHNLREGERSVRLLASTRSARFRAGRGACVIDTYTTSRASYREIACLVAGRRSSAVVVAAAPAAMWNRQGGTLERAVASFTA